MESKESKTTSETNHWWRVFRPLGYWLLFVAVLYLVRWHQRQMELTTIGFTVSLNDQACPFEASATLDTQPVMSGQHLSLGRHVLAVSHPKGVTFTTNLFIWYGPHDLGNVDLKRAAGILDIQANPPVPLLTIRGSEWSITLTNSTGIKQTVPTDDYAVLAQYAHSQTETTLKVGEDMTAPLSLKPSFGAVRLTCNQTDAVYSLQADGKVVESGSLPVEVDDLPVGRYLLTAIHHGHVRRLNADILAGQTNELPADFQYGSITLRTQPDGATVSDSSGHEYGVTPLIVQELLPGTWYWTFQRAGYQTVTVGVDIAPSQTAEFATNLVSTSYVESIQSARQWFAAGDYFKAARACQDALSAQPGDADATALLNQAAGWLKLADAKTLASGGDYVGADQKLSAAQSLLPDNAEIKQLLVEYKSHEPEQLENERVDRLRRPKAVFDNIILEYRDAPLFEEHVIKTTKPAREVAAGIAQALQSTQPAFRVDENRSPRPDTYDIEATLELTGYLGSGTTSGRREVIIVCGQTTDTETEIHFKVIEYKAESTVRDSVAALLGTAMVNNVRYIPIHPSVMGALNNKMQARLSDGVANLTRLIQGVLGQ